MLVRDLDLTLETYNPVSFITRITTEVGASEKTKRDAIKFLIKAEELMITSGKNPVAMAATVVYLASIMNSEKVSQTQVSPDPLLIFCNFFQFWICKRCNLCIL